MANFIHVPSLEILDKYKVSAETTNTSYTQGINSKDILTDDLPEILWQDIIFIEDIQSIWTHGVYYNSPSIFIQ